MRTEITTVTPDLSLPELEDAFVRHQVGGFPVVKDGKLVGIVSRSDIVRQLCVERTRIGMLSDYYWDCSGFDTTSEEASFDRIAESLGRRIDHLRVADVMMPEILTVEADQDISDVARLLLEKHIHRLLVTEQGKLVGLIGSLDLVRCLSA
jgi:CBS domain-containing protein